MGAARFTAVSIRCRPCDNDVTAVQRGPIDRSGGAAHGNGPGTRRKYWLGGHSRVTLPGCPFSAGSSRPSSHCGITRGSLSCRDGGRTSSPDCAREFHELLDRKGIGHIFDLWGHGVNHDWPWWRTMLPHYLERLGC